MKNQIRLYGRIGSVFRILPLLLLGLLICTSSPAFSHYLWTTIDHDSGELGITNLYFEDTPKPGIGEYLQPFVDGSQTWVRTLTPESRVPIQLVEVHDQGNKWLSATLSQSGPRTVETYSKWGVYRFPDTGIDTLLHYYAKHLDVHSSVDLQTLGTSKEFLLDIVPGGYVKPSRFFNLNIGIQRLSDFINRWTGPSVEIFVRWKGKPSGDTHVTIRGPTGPKIHVKTDSKGYARFQAPETGLYTFLAYIEETDLKGVDQGKPYDVVRHTSSLTIQLPIQSPENEELP